jgi:hypothetical protein
MPLARVPVTITVSVMSAASMVIAALAVVEADAVVSASCANSIAGVQANGATIVDLISQLFARSLRMRKSPWVSSFIHHRTRRRRPIARE